VIVQAPDQFLAEFGEGPIIAPNEISGRPSAPDQARAGGNGAGVRLERSHQRVDGPGRHPRVAV